jgi:hypothetical protein
MSDGWPLAAPDAAATKNRTLSLVVAFRLILERRIGVDSNGPGHNANFNHAYRYRLILGSIVFARSGSSPTGHC